MRSKFGGPVCAAMVVGVLLLASCSTTSAPATSGTGTAATKPYGSLTLLVTVGGAGFNLDPQISNTDGHRGLSAAYLDSLVELDTDANLRPGLAERWEIAIDGMTHTFYIRKGVKFHNGDDLTAADVKFSVDRILAPEATHIDAPIWRSQIAKVEMKDDYTVVLTFKVPQFELLKGFDLGGTNAVVPKKYIEEKGVDYFRKNPVGSGPFKVVKFEFGSGVELEAMESHWRAVPKFKNIILVYQKEAAAIASMLRTGELDMASVAPDQVSELKAAGLRIMSWDQGASIGSYIFYDVEHPENYAVGDVRVRKAMSLAINRKELADKLLLGYGEPHGLYFARAGAYFWDPNLLKPDPYDPEGAKKLMAEAGYPNGFSIRHWATGPGSASYLVGQAHAGYWGKLGVSVQFVPIDPSPYRLYFPKHVPELWPSILTGGGGGVLQFERMVTVYHGTKGAIKNHANKRLDELIEKVPLTKDPAEKKRLALEAAVLAKNEYSIIASVTENAIVAIGAKIGEFTPIKGLGLYAATFELITHAK